MATIFDAKQDTKTVVDKAAAEHNAQIKERFQRLQSVERSQFAELSYQAPRASVLAPERPVQTQQPMQEVQERSVSQLFTAETLDRTLQEHAPVAQEPEVQAPVVAQTVAVEGVQLSRFAKVFLCACAAVVTALICLICAFTQIISANDLKLNALESKNAQLRAEYVQVHSELESAKSPETIKAIVEAQGWAE